MKAIAQEARDDPEMLNKAPYTTPIRRCDEVKAARDLVLCCWTPEV
jgi:glycine dehydrogenase subunit 2